MPSTSKKKQKLKLCQPQPTHTQQKIPMLDGSEIFVQIIKQPNAHGIPIVLNDGLGCDGYAWKYLIGHFQDQHPIIHWHYRGHGKSDVPADLDTVCMEVLVKDLQKVLDHLDIDQAIFCGHSMGVQVILEAFDNMPERFAALALICGGYKYPLQTWHAAFERNGKPTLLNEGMKRFFPGIAKSIIANSHLWQPFWARFLPTDFSYRAAINFEVNRERVTREDLFPYFEHLGKMEARVFAQMASSFAEHNAEHVLATIDRPTLIVAGGRDTFSPPWLSFDMQDAIKNSELLHIPDGTHCTPIEHPELINLRLEKFIKDRLTSRTVKNLAPMRQIQVAS